MSRLFWKIFLWFLVAMFLVGSTLALSVASSRSAEEGRHIRSFVERVVRAEAEHAARVYETGGPTELQKYLAEMNEDGAATARHQPISDDFAPGNG
jgi:hypothetical protein